MDLEAHRARVEAHIAAHGVSIATSGEPLPLEPRTAHTIGLHQRGLPELLCTGLSGQTADPVLNVLARRAMDGHVFTVGEVVTGVVDRPLRIAAVAPLWTTLYANQALGHYDRPLDLTALQVLWSDPEGLFPDQPGCSVIVAKAQPVLADPLLPFKAPLDLQPGSADRIQPAELHVYARVVSRSEAPWFGAYERIRAHQVATGQFKLMEIPLSAELGPGAVVDVATVPGGPPGPVVDWVAQPPTHQVLRLAATSTRLASITAERLREAGAAIRFGDPRLVLAATTGSTAELRAAVAGPLDAGALTELR